MRQVNARVAIVAALALVTVGAVALESGASDPASSSVTVPRTVGQTQTVSWTGTVPAGSVHNSDCNEVQVGTEDTHTVDVQAGSYSKFDARFTFQITWDVRPPLPGGVFNPSDLVLTVNEPGGADAGDTESAEVGSSDNSTPDSGTATETVVAHDLGTGTYTVLVCGFTNTEAQSYRGTVSVTTEPKPTLPSLSAGATQGLEFGASVPVDAQRDEAEPLVEIDRNGNIYACGPTGFSNASDYAQVSTDGGAQFHLLGTPPRGQQALGGGGDCALATGITKNAQGNYQYAYAGLGALTGFTTSTSGDNGHTIANAGPNGNGVPGATTQGALADRQWLTFIDDHTVLLNYNQQQPRNTVVQISHDGGLTYDPTAAIGAPNPTFPGPLRYIAPAGVADSGYAYFPWTKGESVNLAVSKDGGVTWTNCNLVQGGDTVKGGTAGFSVADHDTAGNVYVVWSDRSNYAAWMSVVTAAQVAGCNEPVASAGAGDGVPNVVVGTAPIRVDRDPVKTTVFPWVAAGGAPGRVAVATYAATEDGDPNTADFKAHWNVVVDQSLNALDAAPTFAQVSATTHPFHFDSICLRGLNCDTTSPGDRSLADFFAIAYNPVTGRLTIVFDRGNKRPDEAGGHVATTMAATQAAGPSNGGSTLAASPVVRTATSDASGDALARYSALGVGAPPPDPKPVNEPGADLTGVSVGPDAATGGFTVTFQLASLSATSLAQALADTNAQSLVWLLRFTNGFQDAAASAAWSPGGGWSFGFDQYTTGTGPCDSATNANEKCQVYPQATPIAGSVDTTAGTITLTVPRTVLRQLGPADQYGRPTEIAAGDGARFYDGTALTLANNVSATQSHQSWLYPLDGAAAMDFLLPRAKGKPAR